MTIALENAFWEAGNRAIVNDVSVVFSPGQVTAIVGPNGAGKSSLLRLASGLTSLSRGKVLLDDLPLSSFSPAVMAARRAMLMQDGVLTARFTARQLVALGASVSAAHLPHVKRIAMADEILDRVGLLAFAGRDVMSLSGGERQRVHLARVLMQLEAAAIDTSPGFLLLDEPISAQDPARQELILRIARAHADRGGGVVMVLHDLNWAAACADRIVVVHDGRIYAQGAPQTVLSGALVRSVFGLAEECVRTHERTGKPYMLPHDIMH